MEERVLGGAHYAGGAADSWFLCEASSPALPLIPPSLRPSAPLPGRPSVLHSVASLSTPPVQPRSPVPFSLEGGYEGVGQDEREGGRKGYVTRWSENVVQGGASKAGGS